MRPRPEDVDAVLDNALDLLEDSKRCSGAGAIVLAELSLEQASLAAVLWGRGLLDRYGVSDSLIRGEAFLPLDATSVPIATAILVEEIGEFSDRQIERISWKHPPSLQHVESILRFMERMAPYVLDPLRVGAQLRGALPLRARIRLRFWGKDRFVREGKQELAAILAEARKLAIPRLDKRKNELLYARVDPLSGQVALAEIDDELLGAILTLSGLIQDMISKALDAADDADERARKAEERRRFLRRVEKATGVVLLPPDREG